MASRSEILRTLNEWLTPESFQDYCPNGLQVEGREEVSTIVSGVTASQALIDAAVDAGADMILVHHGYFWKGEDQAIRGMKRERIKRLLDHDINLVAYHLPLDDHPDYGNNRQLAEVLGIRDPQPLGGLVWQGELERPMSPKAFADLIGERLARAPLWVGVALLRFHGLVGAPARPRDLSTKLWMPGWMPISVVRFQSPPPILPASAASITMRPGTTPRSVTVFRPWRGPWKKRSG